MVIMCFSWNKSAFSLDMKQYLMSQISIPAFGTGNDGWKFYIFNTQVISSTHFFIVFFYLWTKTRVSFANYRPTCAWRQQCGVTLGTSSLNCFGRPLKRFFRYQTRYRHHVSEAKSYNNEPSITYSMLVQLIDSQDDAVFKQIYFKPLTFKVLFSHNFFHNFIYF